MQPVSAQHTVNPAAASGTRYEPGETYYRHKKTHILYGKGMVQSNYLHPELEEMVALEDGVTLVPVMNARAQLAGQVKDDEFKPRTPPRSVPRFDARPSELQYKHNPIAPQLVSHMREPDAETLRKAAEAAQAHADQRVELTRAQLDAVQRKEHAELVARAGHAQAAADAVAAKQRVPAAPQAASPAINTLLAQQALEPATPAGGMPTIQPLDLSNLTSGNGGQ